VVVVALAMACAPEAKTDAARAQSVEAQVWSPYCPGRLLIDCTTQQARELRVEIARRVGRGQPDEEILDWVRAEFGDAAIARPSDSASGLIIWLVPAVLFVGGFAVLAVVIRRWRAVPARTE
jgi:cytochrome c-type biogenesis protein CcmH